MKKKILSILTSVSLVASALSAGVYAAPSAMNVMDSAIEYSASEGDFSAALGFEASLFSEEGPSPVMIFDSAKEEDTLFGKEKAYKGATLFAELSGEGTKESPYLISSASDLKTMSDNVAQGVGTKAYYELTDDIDLGGAEWNPIGTVMGISASADYSRAFGGHFNGNGFTISNFVITSVNSSYLGLFGFMNAGTIENLTIDNANINFTSSNTDKLYISPLVGRVGIIEADTMANIVNCNVINSSVNVTSNGTIYAGGILGGGSAGPERGNGSGIFIAFTNADCDINIVNKTSNFNHTVSAGGIAGYYGSQTGATITAINCSSKGDIVTDSLSSPYSYAMSGGLFGNLRSYEEDETTGAPLEGGAIFIDSCYSEGNVIAKAYLCPYVAGGFAAQILPTKNVTISNCYSSADISGQYTMKGNSYNLDPTAGGFVGQIFYYYYTNTNPDCIFNCYASGDVIDTTHTDSSAKDTSFVGGFAAYSDAGIFENCYRYENQIRKGSDTCEDEYFDIKVISNEFMGYEDTYKGFDFVNTWQLDTSDELSYPTLREKTGYINFISEGKVYAVGVFANDGKTLAPAIVPEKAPTVDKTFSFNYWSLSENGSAFNFATDTVTFGSNLYAVYSSSPRQYTLSFVSDGEKFVNDQLLNYGSSFRAPTSVPTKNEDEFCYYEFLYWSDKENGEEYDFTGVKLYEDMTFYAVFKTIDKSAWTGVVAESFASGFGSKELPYIITNGGEFALFAKVINENAEGYTDAYFALGDDINLGGNMWVPIGNSKDHPFSANFDGRGYTVRNYKVVTGQYMGLFGMILNGTVTNLCVKDFTISCSTTINDDNYPMFAGGLAAYIRSKKGTASVSGIRVSGGKFEVNANVGHVFAGNIAGYAGAYVLGTTLITDSFSTSDITVINNKGYNYVGGIVGRFDVGSSSSSQIIRCYNTGSVSSTSLHSSRAGGLVGYLYSYGSAYTGGTSPSHDPYLTAEDTDVDVMVKDCFAVANVSSVSTKYDSRVGRVIGEINNYASVKNSFYPRSAGVVINPQAETEVKNVYSTTLSNLKSVDYLTSTLGFDFENTWTFTQDSAFPVLKCMVIDKPMLRVSSAMVTEGNLDATIQVLSSENNYTVVIGVFNARNQLIKLERRSFEGSDITNEFSVNYSGMEKAKYITISAISKTNLMPLFDDVKYYI